jgi:hypothetical protein
VCVALRSRRLALERLQRENGEQSKDLLCMIICVLNRRLSDLELIPNDKRYSIFHHSDTGTSAATMKPIFRRFWIGD